MEQLVGLGESEPFVQPAGTLAGMHRQVAEAARPRFRDHGVNERSVVRHTQRSRASAGESPTPARRTPAAASSLCTQRLWHPGVGVRRERGPATRRTVPVMVADLEVALPAGNADERELLLSWLAWLRGAVLRKIEGLSDADARWTPDGALISLIGIVNHLTHVEWRWIDGAMLGEGTNREAAEFRPEPDVSVTSAVSAYRARAATTDAYARGTPLSQPTRDHDGTDLRWVLLHLINETARHAGHADSTRELLDGVTGE